jgi:hypothetical protein
MVTPYINHPKKVHAKSMHQNKKKAGKLQNSRGVYFFLTYLLSFFLSPERGRKHRTYHGG